MASQVKATVETHCELIEVAGSIRRQKKQSTNIDFVVVTKTILNSRIFVSLLVEISIKS